MDRFGVRFGLAFSCDQTNSSRWVLQISISVNKGIDFLQFVQRRGNLLAQYPLEAIRLATPQASSQLVVRLKPKNPQQKNRKVPTAIYTSLLGLVHKTCQSPGVGPH